MGPVIILPRVLSRRCARPLLAWTMAIAVGLQVEVAAGPMQSAQVSGLKILVIEGEDAVNIVQQKTALAPVVEVRDRNNLPVSGAVVRFAISSGRASFSGARTLTVTTNAAGRAVATGLTPTGSGALHIGASAAFQGQTAVATIAQTNVMTVAQAAAAGTGASGSASAGGAAAGGTGGGGISTTTLGVIGGAAAGGALAANQVLGRNDQNARPVYKGSFNAQTVLTQENFRNGVLISSTTNTTVTMVGTIEITLNDEVGAITGDLDASWTETRSRNGQASLQVGESGSVTVSGGNIQYSHDNSFTGNFTDSSGVIGSGPGLRSYTFTGVLSDGVITGTWRMAFQATLTAPVTPGNGYAESYPVTSATVTLTKQ